MGRAGRPKDENKIPEALQELQEEGLPGGWQRYWQGERREINETAEVPQKFMVDYALLDDISNHNQYVDFDTYTSYGLAVEMIAVYDSTAEDSVVTPEEHQAATETLDALRSKEEVSREGLQAAEKIYRDMAKGLEDEMIISEQIDPDRSFLFQDDHEHCLILAEYMRALQKGMRTMSAGTRSIDQAREDSFYDLVNNARSRSKYG